MENDVLVPLLWVYERLRHEVSDEVWNDVLDGMRLDYDSHELLPGAEKEF